MSLLVVPLLGEKLSGAASSPYLSGLPASRSWCGRAATRSAPLRCCRSALHSSIRSADPDAADRVAEKASTLSFIPRRVSFCFPPLSGWASARGLRGQAYRRGGCAFSNHRDAFCGAVGMARQVFEQLSALLSSWERAPAAISIRRCRVSIR